jgi:mono/diheme cytochrome c family protein
LTHFRNAPAACEWDIVSAVTSRRIPCPLFGTAVIFLTSLSVEARQPRALPAPPAATLQRSAHELYRAACATCHGSDGKGSPQSVVGFDVPLPDFSDCAFAAGEPDPDWYAVVHEGGPVRALDRHMPAFGDALSSHDIRLAISHVRTFCRDSAWPQGDLNLPRAFFTEKAFPENEAVWTMALSRGEERAIESALIYERRLGARNQIELVAPVSAYRELSGQWSRGFGDVALAFKRTLHASMKRGQIAAAGLEVILPTGDASRGLGNGYTVFEPSVMWGQTLPRNSYLQLHAGVELPSVSRSPREGFARAAVGTTLAADRGFGRAWSPQVELLWARPPRGPSEWDVVPQFQVTLSKLQHVMLAAGVRVPITQRAERRPQALVYFLWDWFDGGLFEMWR